MIPYILAAVGGYLIGKSQKKDMPMLTKVSKEGGMMAEGGEMKKLAEGGRITPSITFVGRFDENQLRNKEDEKAIEKAQKETGLKYVDTKLVKKAGKIVAMDVYLIDDEIYLRGGIDYLRGFRLADGGFFDKKEEVVFKFKEGEKIKVLQYSGGKPKLMDATVYKHYAAEQPDGTYFPFYWVVGGWENFDEGKKHPLLYAEDELINRHKNKPKMAEGGEMKDGMMAKRGGMKLSEGGVLAHGLREDDKIYVERGNLAGIKNDKTDEKFIVDISTGSREKLKD